MKTEIIFEDKDILVVYKPTGIATQTSKVGERDVVSELKNYLKGGFVGVVHRLDQMVEGVLVFTKNRESAAALSKLVQDKSSGGEDTAFSKEYLAVVYGSPEQKEARLENLMIKRADRTAEIIETDNVPAEAKKAILRYEVVRSAEVDGHVMSLVRVHLETGRFHQIRAQLAHIGYPIIGDRKYGTSESIKCAEALHVRGVSLCADSLTFTLKHGKENKKYCYSHKPEGRLFAFMNGD